MDIFGTGSDSPAHSNTSAPQKMTPEQIKQANDITVGIICIVGVLVFSLAGMEAMILFAIYRAAERKADSGKWLRVLTAFFSLAAMNLLFFGYESLTLGILPMFWGKGLLYEIQHSFFHRLSWFSSNPLLRIQEFAFLSLAVSSILFWVLRSWILPSPDEDERKNRLRAQRGKWMLTFIDPLGRVLNRVFEFLSLPIRIFVESMVYQTEMLGGSVGLISLVLLGGLGTTLGISLTHIDPVSFVATARWVGIAVLLSSAVLFIELARRRAKVWIHLVLATGMVLVIYIWTDLTHTLDRRAFLILASFVLTIFYLGVFSSVEFFLRRFLDLGAEGSSTKTKESIVVGRDQFDREVALTKDVMNHHVHVVGASGFGKTNFLSHLLFQTIEQGRGLLFLDLKADREMLEAVKAECHKANRLSDFKIFSLADPSISISYNLFQHGNASELKDKLMGAFEWSEVFYEKEAESLLLRTFRALVFLRDQKSRSFHMGDLYQCLIDPKAFLLLANEIAEGENEIREELLELTNEMESAKKRENLQGLKSEIENFLKAEFGKLLQSSEGLDLFQSMQKNEVVYLLLDSRRYGKTAERLGRMVIQDISAASGKRGTLPKEKQPLFTVIVDEFAPLVTESFVRLLQQARSSNIGIVIAHQELADLRALSEATQNQIMQNTSTTVAFLQKMPDSADLLAGMIGTFETTQLTRQKNDQASFLEPTYTGVSSERQVHEFKVHPSVFKRLLRGECILISKYPKDAYAQVKVAKAKLSFKELTLEETALINSSPRNLLQLPLDLRSLRKAYQERIVSKLTPPVELLSRAPTPGDPEWFS